MKKLVVIVLAFLMVVTQNFASLQAQDLAHYKRIVKELSSAKYQGRGYACGWQEIDPGCRFLDA